MPIASVLASSTRMCANTTATRECDDADQFLHRGERYSHDDGFA